MSVRLSVCSMKVCLELSIFIFLAEVAFRSLSGLLSALSFSSPSCRYVQQNRIQMMMMFRGQTLLIFDLLDWIVNIFFIRLEASWVAQFAAKTISTFVFEEYLNTISQLSKKSNSKNKFYVCNSLENNFMMSNGNDF